MLGSWRCNVSITFNRKLLESFHLRIYGLRDFSHAAPLEWNALPQEMRFASSLSSFKNQLKTYLYEKAYEL